MNSKRRYSLGNLSPTNQKSQPDTASTKYSFLNTTPQMPQSTFLTPSQELFTDQTNLLYSKYIQQQQQQQYQQQQIQNQENISNLLKLCNNYQSLGQSYLSDQNILGSNFPINETSPPSISSSLSSMTANQILSAQNQKSIQNLQSLQNFRRRSYCVGNTLRPVIESRSSSPVQQLYQDQLIQQQQQQLLEQKLNLLTSSAFMSPPTPPPQQHKKLSLQFTPSTQSVIQPNISKLRAMSTNSIDQMTNLAKSSAQSSSSLITSTTNLFTPITLQNKSFLDSFEEKLATTGNIFQRREDWSILARIPINKQNTIHIRLEDEGPYGNDETRCFVLSHFSSLGIKDLNCIFCDCDLIVYDRFPLVDGTLFVSPHKYDQSKSIPSIVSNKQQYVNAVCLNCLNGEKNHEIKCKTCKKLWYSLGAFSLQIGTLYKYDIFAAFPCCQKRLNCNKCGHKLMDIDAALSENFSVFSEERECMNCKTRDYHFIKPLNDIYQKCSCQISKEEVNNKFDDTTNEEKI